MHAIDTNVLVRLLVRDDPRQLDVAEKFIVKGAWISHLVLVETLWVLDAVYERSAEQIGSAIDVRQLILDALAQKGFTGDIPALHIDTAPIIETFAPPAPRASADRDQPSAITGGADDQPFPFYGRVRVSWK